MGGMEKAVNSVWGQQRTSWGWGDLWIRFRLDGRRLSLHKEGWLLAFMLYVLNSALTWGFIFNTFSWRCADLSCFYGLWLNALVKLSIFYSYPFFHSALRHSLSICFSGFLVPGESTVSNIEFLHISLVILPSWPRHHQLLLATWCSPFMQNAMMKNRKHFIVWGSVVTSNRHPLTQASKGIHWRGRECDR